VDGATIVVSLVTWLVLAQIQLELFLVSVAESVVVVAATVAALFPVVDLVVDHVPLPVTSAVDQTTMLETVKRKL